MFAYGRSLVAACLVLAAGGAAYAASGWLTGSTDEKLKTLAAIQPGLGTVMMEYSARYSTMYYAAKNGNWALAAYQLKEAREIQEVGETTRPAKAAALKAFEKLALVPIEKAIEAKDFKKFETAFEAGIRACNACHAGLGHPYIKYRLPSSAPAPLSMKP